MSPAAIPDDRTTGALPSFVVADAAGTLVAAPPQASAHLSVADVGALAIAAILDGATPADLLGGAS